MSVGGLLMNILVIAVIPAFAEEFFFRGFLMGTLQRIMGKHASVWVSAAIFSAVHFQFYGFFSRLVLGAILGYLVVFSRSLWTSMLAHFLNNFLMLMVAFFMLSGDIGNGTDPFEPAPMGWLAATASLTITCILFYFFRRNQTHPKIINE